MSDTENTPAESQDPAEQADTQAPEQTPEDLGEAGKKALTAEREARKQAEREIAGYKARLKDIEDANLSELEKAQRERDEYRETVAKIQRENDRSRVALEKGVPSDLIEFITGDTAEDMAAKADLLISRLNATPSTPKPDRTQGASGKEAPVTTAQQFAQQLGDF
ncbi:DUF4355 domain-containing protein [Nesterenkonia aurantiaca]|uniref:capsid assembly scaffolding protein Gp46 family protein n=1 Tax=Nesterenkonia aurantiaca TaxID=1436010 RepID=UPI003EE70F8F